MKNNYCKDVNHTAAQLESSSVLEREIVKEDKGGIIYRRED